jgi:hypothetical protein
MAEHGISRLALVCARVQAEMQYWQGYDPKLLENLCDEVSVIERQIKENDDSRRRHRREIMGSVFQFFIVIFGIAAVIVGIAFAVNLGTNKTNKAYERIMAENGNITEKVIMKDWDYNTIKIHTPASSSEYEYEIYMRKKP